MLIVICNGYKIGQVDIASIINTVDSVLLDCIVISHMFSEWHLFSLYHSLTNNEYITIDGHHHVPVAGIGSITLTIILPNGISKLIFTNTLHILTLGADLISLGVFHCKGALICQFKTGKKT